MAGARRARLRAEDRLRRAGQFRRVFRTGVRAEGALLSLVVSRNDVGHMRVGLAASRRIGGAVARNRAKRLVRESFRAQARGRALDIVVLPKAGIRERSQADVGAEFQRLLERLRSRLGHARREGPAAPAD